MISPLDRKLLRDLAGMKGQVVAVSLVMACGLAMMIMTRSLILTLESTRDAYYQKYALADVFGSLKRAPLAMADRVAELPGVSRVEARVAVDVTLDLPWLSEPATGHIISLPEDGSEPKLNRVFLRSGRMPEPAARREVVLGEAFALENGLRPGDSLVAVINGHRETLQICGIGLSPEFVFEAPAGQTLPDHRRFSVIWMNYRALAVAYNLDGAFNDIVLDLAPGTAADPVIAQMDLLLAPYGAGGAYVRKDQASAQRLDDELRVLHSLSVAYPLVFLSVAAFMVNAVLARIVRLQSEQIAQMKALGYSSRQVGVHYLKFVFIIGLLGTVIGGIDYLLTFQWNRQQRQDAAVFLVEPASGKGLHDLEHLPAGLLFGKGLALLIMASFSTETVRMPIFIESSTYAVAIGVVLTAAALSFALVSRMLAKLDLVGVLKARD